MADTCENAYAAGLFDGEGCVQLYMRPVTYGQGKPNNSFRSNLSIASCDPAAIIWIQERWGGSLRHYVRRGKSAGHRDLYNLQLTARDAEGFARDIYPYLIIKREQMALWLEARSKTYQRGRKGIPSGGLPAEEVTERQRLVAEIKALKRREYSHR